MWDSINFMKSKLYAAICKGSDYLAVNALAAIKLSAQVKDDRLYGTRIPLSEILTPKDKFVRR